MDVERVKLFGEFESDDGGKMREIIKVGEDVLVLYLVFIY